MWLTIAAGIGWIGLVAHPTYGLVSASAADMQLLHSSADHAQMAMGVGAARSAAVKITTQVAMWGAMLMIMVPLIGPNVRFVALRSPIEQRRRVAVAVVAGWSLVWSAAALLLTVGGWLIARVAGQVGTLVALTIVAVAWQVSPVKRRSAVRCHRTFAPPIDTDEAVIECLHYGVRLGVDCVASCWALMAVMAAAGHSLLAVVPLFWLSWYERRRRPHHDPRAGTVAAAVGLTGVVLIALTASVGLG